MKRNHEAMPILVTILMLAISIPIQGSGQDSPVAESQAGPVQYVYATPDSFELKAFVFSPPGKKVAGERPGIVIFHGGGWNIGSPEWAFGRAKHFAELGMVAVAAQYRLSDQLSITPLEAMADARAVIRWMRSNTSLGIASDRIVAYGWSAGAHLAAGAAMINDPTEEESISCVPNALILVSPGVALEKDSWARKLLGDRANIREISPDNFVCGGLPPTIILQGRTDTVTPLPGVQTFCDRMREAGNRCDLHIYNDVGHLFTPSDERDDGYPNPDREVQANAYLEADKFLKSLGFID